MKRFLACIDAGTSGERCIIYDIEGNCMGEGYFEVSTQCPRNGWAEQDPHAMVEMASGYRLSRRWRRVWSMLLSSPIPRLHHHL